MGKSETPHSRSRIRALYTPTSFLDIRHNRTVSGRVYYSIQCSRRRGDETEHGHGVCGECNCYLLFTMGGESNAYFSKLRLTSG